MSMFLSPQNLLNRPPRTKNQANPSISIIPSCGPTKSFPVRQSHELDNQAERIT